MPTPFWIVRPRPNPDAAVRLYCVPYAGAGIAAFARWVDFLPSADVGILRLPGRESRLQEPCCAAIEEAANVLLQGIDASDCRPVVLFGHSMGALVAFEAARLLDAAGLPIRMLVVSGRRAPSLREPLTPVSHLPEPEFLAEVQSRYGAIDAALLDDPELRGLLVPTLRADITMVERYRYRPATPLSCPIVAYGGTSDPHAPGDDLREWNRETTARCEVRLFPGGHFFIQERRDEVLARLRADLASVPPSPPGKESEDRTPASPEWNAAVDRLRGIRGRPAHAAPPRPYPASGTLHFWTIDLRADDADVSRLFATLDEQERHRANRFATSSLRRRFIVAHAALRQILSLYLGVPARSVTTARTASGKPGLVGSPLGFSLAHSRDLAVCALATDRRIGADVEALRIVEDADDLVRRYFSEDEARQYMRLPLPDRVRAFLTMWTRKEAFVKATGEGLSRPLDSFSVSAAWNAPRLLSVKDGENAGDWSMETLEAAPGYVASVACDGPVLSVLRLAWADRSLPVGSGFSRIVQSA